MAIWNAVKSHGGEFRLTGLWRRRERAVHPLPEVFLRAVCGMIASCDDYEDIVEGGEAHLGFLH